jgi:GT2 family glycosyltransferase
MLTGGAVVFGAVAIGRNEGDRLKSCLSSLSTAAAVVYVDSGSIDGSSEWARRQPGVEVVDLDLSLPFTAARARNAGFRRLCQIAPQLRYVQFIDGDCELDSNWPARAVAFLDAHQDVGAVAGRRRERWPERSIYNWLCDQEWNSPAGETRAFGGDVMMRTEALQRVGGYRDDLIAGEEPELCVRLRADGWRVWRLACEMTLHDAAMTRFGQWWRRVVRSGYAFAQGAQLHGSSSERHWVWESRRAWLWGAALPLTGLVTGVAFGPWGLVIWLVYPAQLLRQIGRGDGPLRRRAIIAAFQVLARFPEAFGQCKFFRDRLCGRPGRLIEYK